LGFIVTNGIRDSLIPIHSSVILDTTTLFKKFIIIEFGLMLYGIGPFLCGS
jgi:hypothetical protein